LHALPRARFAHGKQLPWLRDGANQELYRMASGLLFAACLIGMDTFRATRYLKNEAGHEVIIDQVGAAFYVWELSFVALLVLVLMRLSEMRSSKQPQTI
ncbi:hypothetical protein M3O57_20485, partial [Xanthomonas nasturtii]|nr:hypothetical protein [Xanthomonas nasturtii]MCL1567484.1 hypothetical protein [Xanthomonas nasturtii]MCL1571331.1 hypothetical protein [Xanthomonas nasturtii]MCL1575198.1 hypothetical protein [Xanthomonas nasturtii]MCL1582886.1 hypothetical protein [Xanthomonas nasturtii]